MRVVVAAMVVLCVLALPLVADPPLTKLRVEVKSLKDQPVERAAVIVRFVEGRSVLKFGKQSKKSWELRTNQEGIANFPRMPQGKVQVQVIAKGYQTFGDTYDVNEEERTILIKLNPPQPQHTVHQ